MAHCQGMRISLVKEKDRLFRLTNKSRKAQTTSGWIQVLNYWRQMEPS